MTTVVGIGADIEHVRRFQPKKRIPYASFLQKIFTAGELAYCFSKKDPAQHLAARFAGKEAVVKALKSAGAKAIPSFDYKQIEIIRDLATGPRVRLRTFSWKKGGVFITLSHTAQMALAVAIVTETT